MTESLQSEKICRQINICLEKGIFGCETYSK